MSSSKRVGNNKSDLAAEAASIEYSVKLAEKMALDSDASGWLTKKTLQHTPVTYDAKLAEKEPLDIVDTSDSEELGAEAASIEFSVKYAEQVARESNVDAESWPTKKMLSNISAATEIRPEDVITVTAPVDEELAAEVASIEYSVKLAKKLILNEDVEYELTPEEESLSKAGKGDELTVEASALEHSVKVSLDSEIESVVWPKLHGWTGKEMRRQAKYQMYSLYEQHPEELKKLAVQVITSGCPDLDEKGAKNFVNKAWKNKRLQENIQGAINATYYREIFEAEESRSCKRSVPEVYMDGENPKIIFSRMKSLLFKNKEFPNRIHLLNNKKNRHRPLPMQLFELFEAEKKEAAKRMKKAASQKSAE